MTTRALQVGFPAWCFPRATSSCDNNLIAQTPFHTNKVRGLEHEIFFRWDSISGFASGIPPLKSRLTPFVNLDSQEVKSMFDDIPDRYWRDIPYKEAMDSRFEQFTSQKELNVEHAAADRAWKRVDDHYAKYFRALKVTSLGEATDNMPQGTSPGLPYTRQGFKTKRDCMSRIKKQARSWWRSAEKSGGKTSHLKVYPCIAGARRVAREVPKNKPRLVWVYPGSVLAVEAQFAQPFIAALSSERWIGWAVNWLDGGDSRYRMFPPSSCHAIASVDFDSFDANVVKMWINRAFDLIRRCFKMNKVEEGMFELIRNYFIHTPILLGQSVRQKHRGIPSGSYFTQVVGTIVNQFYTFYVDERQSPIDGSRLAPSGHMWLGDDSRLLFNEWYGVHDFKKDWVLRFLEVGGSVSETKFAVTVLDGDHTDYGSFLSRLILTDYPHLGFDFDKFRAQVLIPEDEDSEVGVFAARLIGLTWAYGFDKRAYRILSRLYPSDVKPVLTARVMRYLKYALGITGVDLTTFPSFDRVHLRYFGYV